MPIGTLSPRERTAMRDILMFHSVIVRDKVTRQCPQTTTFEKEKKKKEKKGELKPGFEPSTLCLSAALPLGQTG